jgi:hypothetical protein
MTETTETPRKSWHEQLEDSGYVAGDGGLDLEKSSLWGDAWTPGSNDVAWVIAGWVAGRAMRRVRQETGEHDAVHR